MGARTVVLDDDGGRADADINSLRECRRETEERGSSDEK
jgi:hypothetical protein